MWTVNFSGCRTERARWTLAMKRERKGRAVGQSLIRLLWLTFVALFSVVLKTHLPDEMTTDDLRDIYCGSWSGNVCVDPKNTLSLLPQFDLSWPFFFCQDALNYYFTWTVCVCLVKLLKTEKKERRCVFVDKIPHPSRLIFLILKMPRGQEDMSVSNKLIKLHHRFNLLLLLFYGNIFFIIQIHFSFFTLCYCRRTGDILLQLCLYLLGYWTVCWNGATKEFLNSNLCFIFYYHIDM